MGLDASTEAVTEMLSEILSKCMERLCRIIICFHIIINNLFVFILIFSPDIEDIGSRSHGYGEHASRAEINIRDVQQALADEVIYSNN